MTALVLFLQILLPGGLLLWLARFPAASIAGYLLQAAGVGLLLIALGLIAIWTVPPRWVPVLYGAIWVAAVAFRSTRRRLSALPPWPAGRLGLAGAAVSLALIAVGAWATGLAVAGRALPPVEVVDTLFFSDRPERIAGNMATAAFVPFWSQGTDSFLSDPPNADLSILEDGTLRQTVVELRDPILEGEDLHHAVRILNGEMPSWAMPCQSSSTSSACR